VPFGGVELVRFGEWSHPPHGLQRGELSAPAPYAHFVIRF
jgi:hypothetical protein